MKKYDVLESYTESIHLYYIILPWLITIDLYKKKNTVFGVKVHRQFE